MTQAFKILIVDDNSLYRRFLSKAAEATHFSTELETAPSGSIALKKIPVFNPDIVLLDIEMPDMNGIEVLQAIKRDYPHIIVILVSGVNSRSADITIDGLSSGASDFVPKPMGSSPEENIATLRNELARVFEIAVQKRARREKRGLVTRKVTPQAPRGPTVVRPNISLLPARIDVVAIGISTGGPTALEEMIPRFPGTLKAPVLIVQHMPPLFTESLAKSLNRKSKLPVFHAEEGQEIRGGCVYLAQGGKHMVVKKNPVAEGTRLFIQLNDDPPVNSCKPAVDVLFKSLAVNVGRHILAVIMTGMGQDGLDGVADIKKREGYCLTQSEASCTVYGMPFAVDNAGLSDESVDLADLPGRISTLAAGISA